MSFKWGLTKRIGLTLLVFLLIGNIALAEEALPGAEPVLGKEVIQEKATSTNTPVKVEKTNSFVAKKVGVLEFENQTKKAALGSAAADSIMARLMYLGSTEVLDRSYFLKEIAANGSKQTKGIFDPAWISAVAEKFNLDFVIMGNVTSSYSQTTPSRWTQVKMGQCYVPQFVPGYSSSSVDLEVLLLDVHSAKIVATEKIHSTSSTESVIDAMGNAGDDTVKRIYRFIPLQGKITKIEGERVTINLGKLNQVFAKMQFTLDQTTTQEQKKLPRMEVVSVSDQECIAVLKNKNTIVKIGDPVTMKP